MDQATRRERTSKLTYLSHVTADGQLLRNYTQNIDTLESQAGVEKVLQCHGEYLRMTQDPKLMSRIVQNSFMPCKLSMSVEKTES